ncbi:LOW QUALITY PROTEIN: chromodomain-helicase-DNA-binding protein 7-like [Centruroides vittatus]|uniref:LOW QUALITY PROTEIN: chromodomain-helicase-DNA-binding protein 7-like n=1 Tax=Centruroides vittatus TaxID=120091 RepID=UPI00350FADAD
MAEYHLLGGGFGVSGNEMEDSTGMVGSGGYGHNMAEPGIGTEMLPSNIPAGPSQNSNPMISGMMPHQQSPAESQVEHGGMSNYHQSGPVHGYQQNEVPQKLHHYNVYNGPATQSGQYVSGPRFTHLGDASHPSSGVRQQPPQAVPPSQMQMYQHQGMGGSHYGQRPQQPNPVSVHPPQNSAQYPGQYGSVPHSQYQHHQQHPIQHVNQSNEMWQNAYGHQQHTRLSLSQGQTYSHQQPPTQNHGANPVQHGGMPLQGSRPIAPTQNQYMPGQDFQMAHSPVQTPSMQRPPVYRMAASQSNQNGSHITQTTGTPSGGTQFPHVPMSQSDQSVPPYSQGPYAPTSQPVARAHFSGTNASGTISHQTSGQMSSTGVPRPMQQMGYPCASPRINSGQQHGGSLPPNSPAQYPMSYSPNQTFTNTAQSAPHVSGSSNPTQLSTYASPQHVPQAPTSPQYRGHFPPHINQSPRQPTPTPPSGSPMPPASHTPERMVHPPTTSTPQSQGSYPSPSTSHMSSPGQGPSPGTPSNSLQHLEQMVMPRMTTGSTTPSAAPPNIGASSNSVMVQSPVNNNYYTHLSQPQPHHSTAPPVESYSQPQSPAFSHMSPQPRPMHQYLGQTPMPSEQQSPMISHNVGTGPNVPNSQTLHPSTTSGPLPRTNNNSGVDDRMTTGHFTPSNINYNNSNNGSFIQPVMGPETDMQHPHTVSSPVPSHITPVPPNSSLPYHSNQSFPSGNSFEIQQIQQELQQLYGMHQSPETQQKITELQERLRYFQSQNVPPSTSPLPPNAPGQPISSVYAPSPYGYNSGSQEMMGMQHNQQNLAVIPPMSQPPDMVPPPQEIMDMGIGEGQDQIITQPVAGETKRKGKGKKQTKIKTRPKSTDSLQNITENDSNLELSEVGKEQEVKVTKRYKKRKAKDKDQNDSQEEKEPKPKKQKKTKSKEPKERKTKPTKESKEPSESSQTEEGDDVKDLDEGKCLKEGKPKKEKKESKGKTNKLPTSKENKSKSPKKKMPKIALKFGKKKKRKRLGSSENSDLEVTPPPSPADGEGGIQKRRSARNTKRKKYTDDIDLHLTDDDGNDSDVERAIKQSTEGKAVQVMMDINVEDFMVVEKILSMRIRTIQKEPENVSEEEGSQLTSESVDIEEFFVKYKSLSYLHCEWKTQEELERNDKRVSQKIKRFKQKRENLSNFFDFLEEEAFNPDYVEVDRVLDVSETVELIQPNTLETDMTITEDKKENSNSSENNEEVKEINKDFIESTLIEKEGSTDTNETIKADSELTMDTKPDFNVEEQSEACEKLDVKNESNEESENKNVESEKVQDSEENKLKRIARHYLVKWRGLPYEESTWELEEDVDANKIVQFHRFKDPPPKEKWKPKKRPKPSEWKKLEESAIYKGNNTLREYQLEGVNWLTFCWYNGQNCILADEMGLGKTIQSIAFLNEVSDYGITSPFLVIAPLSTIGNWQREFETWTDLNAITYHGSSASRNMIQEYEMYYKNEKGERILEVYKFQVMITTFEIVLSDCLELREIPWRCVIIDEAHRLKNRNCKLLEGLRLLNTEHRVLLTGTPLQNNVEELFSLLNFLEPNRFVSTEAFLEEFGELKTEGQVEKLKALLKPMMLRRLKEDVEKSLAPKEETIVEVELTNIQKKYYRAILERNFTFLSKGGCGSNIPNLMNTMMELRKCCIHPYLINGAEEQIMHDYKSQHEDCAELALNAMIQASGKLVLIDKLLPRLRASGHRVLVFSQMVRCLDILEDYLVHRRYPYERIDGRVRGNLRQAAIDRFCKPDSDRFVFLLCTRAGGLGINLTAADTVIIFDSDWNPQNDLQAQARCHRIGQSKAVKVYRLICRNTYERDMFDKASLKLGLDRAVLQSMNSQKDSLGGVSQQLSKKEIEDLLRKGAYGAIMEDDNAGDKFCEEDIDHILQRRTHVITLEGEGKGSTFAKATFSASNNRSDIEIDDPNFWEKWAKKANLDVDELKNRNDLIIQEPRRRTQTRRFGADDHMLDLSELESSDDDDESISTRTRGARGRGSRTGPTRGRGSRNRRLFDREIDDGFDEATGNWSRGECFKVEKGLLTFGWGRWEECLAMGCFKRSFTIKDVEEISRVILLYCLQHYKGDEKIKGFIWDLITPTADGETRVHKNHSGLSAPVPRGRKGRKLKKEIKPFYNLSEEWSMWIRNEKNNPDFLLTDETYKRHLQRHSNKVLLRVRLLYYLKHEVIGDLHDQVCAGIPATEIHLPSPCADGEPPAIWWDPEADKSLLIGVYKHGYERYNVMRHDPSLCFLARCGPPDHAALLAELNVMDDYLDDPPSNKYLNDFKFEKEMEEEFPESPAVSTNDSLPSKFSGSEEVSSFNAQDTNYEIGKLPFPSPTDLNTRLRRIITGYQRSHKKQELKLAQKARRIERREKFEAAIKEREMKKKELQQRWSRREEADFYRTVSTFGVEYDHKKGTYNWNRFRAIARLDRKYDETLTEYFIAFYGMCKRVCGRKLTDDEEPISEERASRCLQRIDLLNKIREEIMTHPELDLRLKLCQPSMDLPDWWQCGKHDKDLLIGAARHGLSRMDYHLLHDPDLSFKDVARKQSEKNAQKNSSHVSTPTGCTSPVTSVNSVEDRENDIKEEKKEELVEEMNKPSEVTEPEKDEVESSTVTTETNNTEDKNVPEAVSEDLVKIKTENDDNQQEIENSKVDNVNNNEESNIVEEEEEKKCEEESKEAKTKEIETEENDVKKSEITENAELPEVKSEILEETPKVEAEKETEDQSDNTLKETNKEILAPNLEDSQEGTSQNDELASQESFNIDIDINEPTVAQLLAQSSGSSVRWPKDKVLQIRLEHICHAVEKNEWPTIRPSFLQNFPGLTSLSSLSTSALPPPTSASPSRVSPAPSISSQGQSSEPTPYATPEHTPHRESFLPDIRISPELGNSSHKSPSHNDDSIKVHRRRRRRRRFEIEAERAKLRALLSQNIQNIQHHQQQLQQVQQFLTPSSATSILQPRLWKEHSVIEGEKSTSNSTSVTSSSNGPPPAHQNSAPRLTTSTGTLDLRVKPSSSQSATLTNSNSVQRNQETGNSPSSPMDLSSTSSPFGMSSFESQSPSQRSRGGSSPLNGEMRGRGRVRPRGKLNGRGGSRIDALALNLQARKQQQIMEEQQQQQQQRQHQSVLQTSSILHELGQQEKSRDTELQDHELQLLKEHAQELQLHGKKGGGSSSTEESVRLLRNRNVSLGLASPSVAHSSSIRHDSDNSASRKLHSGNKIEERLSNNPFLTDQNAAVHQDFKKWLEEHPELVAANPNLLAAAAAMAFNPMPCMPHTELLELPDSRRRGRRPRIDPSKLDYERLTGEENVSVINRITGKKITGSKAPTLKHLADWLEKNPMFDVDPKWGPLVRDKGNLPEGLHKRIMTPLEKRGRRTAASMLASAQAMGTPSSTSSSLAFPSTSSMSPLSFANTGMLTGFPGMKFFVDSTKSSSTTPTTATSTTTPLFLPFGGLASMGITSPLFGFPGFNFQGLGSTTASLNSSTTLSSSKEKHEKEREKNKDEKVSESSSRKISGTNEKLSGTGTTGSSNNTSSSPLSSASSLPFLHYAPGLLYNPLGLGGFALSPNLPASFASLSQAGLVNGLGNLSTSVTSTSITPTTSTSLSTRTTNSSLLRTVPTSRSNRESGVDKRLASHDSDNESMKSFLGNHDEEEEERKLESSSLNDHVREELSVKEVGNSTSLLHFSKPVEKANLVSEKLSKNERTEEFEEKTDICKPQVDFHSKQNERISEDPTSLNKNSLEEEKPS